MTWALANSNSTGVAHSGTVSSLAVTFPNAVTANNLICVAVAVYNSPGYTISVQDSVNTTNYTQEVISTNYNNFYIGLYYFLPPIGGSGFQITASFSGLLYASLNIQEFSYTSG